MAKENGSMQTTLSGKISNLPEFQKLTSTQVIVQELLAQGLSLNDIVMPGGAKGLILHIADDFDAPLEEFEDDM